MDITILIILTVASFLAGFIDSIAGGGGLILMPSLLLAGIPAQIALGTNKFAATFGTTTALYNFIRKKLIIWKIAFIGIIFSLIGAVLGAKAVLVLEQSLLAKIIILFLPVAAVITFIPKRQLRRGDIEFSHLELYFLLPLGCLLIGFYDGFLGPGTGSFLILFLYLVIGVHLLNASAIAKVFNMVSNVGALATFALAGKIIYVIGLPLAAANILGGYLGSHLAIKKGQNFIKFFLMLAFVILLISLIVKYVVK